MEELAATFRCRGSNSSGFWNTVRESGQSVIAGLRIKGVTSEAGLLVSTAYIYRLTSSSGISDKQYNLTELARYSRFNQDIRALRYSANTAIELRRWSPRIEVSWIQNKDAEVQWNYRRKADSVGYVRRRT